MWMYVCMCLSLCMFVHLMIGGELEQEYKDNPFSLTNPRLLPFCPRLFPRFFDQYTQKLLYDAPPSPPPPSPSSSSSSSSPNNVHTSRPPKNYRSHQQFTWRLFFNQHLNSVAVKWRNSAYYCLLKFSIMLLHYFFFVCFFL